MSTNRVSVTHHLHTDKYVVHVHYAWNDPQQVGRYDTIEEAYKEARRLMEQ